jgi:hypothetical protein
MSYQRTNHIDHSETTLDIDTISTSFTSSISSISSTEQSSELPIIDDDYINSCINCGHQKTGSCHYINLIKSLKKQNQKSIGAELFGICRLCKSHCIYIEVECKYFNKIEACCICNKE